MSKINVAVIFGGASSEHEVSLRSVSSVLENMDTDRFNPLPIGITKDGRWLLYEGDASLISNGEWVNGRCVPACILPDTGVHGIAVFRESGTEFVRIDVAFPVLHGKNGEDGTIQGLFTLAGIPFVGCGTLSSAVCMDKAVANTVFEKAGIPHCAWDSATAHELNESFETVALRWEQMLGYPMFVKPANAGSSVGISRADNRAQLLDAVQLALQHDDKLVAEEAVVGQELECAVLGDAQLYAPLVGEILPPENEFYSYDEKYTTDTTGLNIPAAIPSDVSERLRELAQRAFRAAGCCGLSRVDFFLRESDGELLINEINTLPGFTSISMFPKLMVKSGLSYSQLVTSLLETALKRGAR